MGKGGGGTSTTTQDIPAELKPLYTQSGRGVMNLQNEAPLSQFLSANPLNVPGLSPNQSFASSRVRGIEDRPFGESLALGNVGSAVDVAGRRVTGENVLDSPAIQAARTAFRSGALPLIENRYKMQGLGRSTNAGNAIAAAEAQFLYPAIQDELGREERGIQRLSDVYAGTAPLLSQIGGAETGRTLSGIEAGLKTGDVERDVGLQESEAQLNDYLRRQALSENALFTPFSQLPSTFGSTTRTRQSGGGGLFK